ncbi:hypothetical protein V5799_014805, partial [Amblyomma americanum]
VRGGQRLSCARVGFARRRRGIRGTRLARSGSPGSEEATEEKPDPGAATCSVTRPAAVHPGTSSPRPLCTSEIQLVPLVGEACARRQRRNVPHGAHRSHELAPADRDCQVWQCTTHATSSVTGSNAEGRVCSLQRRAAHADFHAEYTCSSSSVQQRPSLEGAICSAPKWTPSPHASKRD